MNNAVRQLTDEELDIALSKELASEEAARNAKIRKNSGLQDVPPLPSGLQNLHDM